MKLDIESAFLTSGYSVYEFYQRPGVGFYIPLYQREYSWDKDNAEQLLEDIEKGVSAMTEYETEIRFLGTIITVNEGDKKRIQPQDPKSLPPTIEKVIDGQQRLTTIGLLASLLYKHIVELETKLLKLDTSNKDEFIEINTIWKNKLLDIFSVDLQSGNPKRKPKIIRGYIDFWTREGKNEEAYKSEPSLFFADFILEVTQNNKSFGSKPTVAKSRFSTNFRLMDKWLKETVSEAHTNDDDQYPKAWDLLDKERLQEDLWGYERDNLLNIINTKDIQSKKSESYLLCSLVQVFAVCHYILERCCFTVIQPKDENWAFDMFQSLNASGTPLTAIETFRPLVVNTTELEKEKFEYSEAKKHFERIETLFKDATNAASKSKLTNEFLTSIAIVLDSYKLESHFSSQRKYLERIYTDLPNYTEKCKLINFMANYADFYKNIWIDYKGDNNLVIEKINTNAEAELASLLILFLKRSNHRMSITILACFYSDILEGKPDSISNFVAAVKAIAAFYIIWRAADSNAGLDNVYRNFFKGIKNDTRPAFVAKDWLSNQGKSLDLQTLKIYLANILEDKGLSHKDDWVLKASSYLKYETSSSVCFISLLIAAHDTIPDNDRLGLIKVGTPHSNPYLKLEKWNAKDLKEIEHIAPKDNAQGWDSTLYDLNSKLYDSIGNLTLLPESVNKSASNRSWEEKFLYYKHLAEKDPDALRELSIKAQNKGIHLNKNTITLLQNSNYNSHILPILSLENQVWDSNIVEYRSVKILEIVWDKITQWLYL
jgi:hypothetical protein